MKVFLWRRVDKCTDSWHPEGGVVVFADSEDRARELATIRGCAISPDEAPNDIRDCSGGEEAVYLMPDAGCC